MNQAYTPGPNDARGIRLSPADQEKFRKTLAEAAEDMQHMRDAEDMQHMRDVLRSLGFPDPVTAEDWIFLGQIVGMPPDQTRNLTSAEIYDAARALVLRECILARLRTIFSAIDDQPPPGGTTPQPAQPEPSSGAVERSALVYGPAGQPDVDAIAAMIERLPADQRAELLRRLPGLAE